MQEILWYNEIRIKGSEIMVKLQEVSIPGCIECIQFKKIWEEIKNDFPRVEFQEYDGLTPEGQELIQKYHILAAPGIIINDELFSTGGVNKEKLIEKLKSLSK